MNSFNLIQNIYKSFSVEDIYIANLQQQLHSLQDPEQVLIFCYSNIIDIYRINDQKKEYIENISQISLYADIQKLYLIKSSQKKYSDILFILTTDLQYRFFKLSQQGETQILAQGEIDDNEQEKNANNYIFFHSQQASQEDIGSSRGQIGVYTFCKHINGLFYEERNGRLELSVMNINIPSQIDNIINIISLSNDLLGVFYTNARQDAHFYEQFEIENGNRLIKANKRNYFLKESSEQVQYILPLVETNQQQQNIIIFADGIIEKWNPSMGKNTQKIGNFDKNIICHCHVNENLYFLATEETNYQASLFLINFVENKIDIKYLGRISVPQKILNLGNNHIFIASTADDCQLLKVNNVLVEKSYLENKVQLPNLSSLYCMQVLESEFNQRLILTSPFKKNSLNFFQKGINLTCKADFKFPLPVKFAQMIFSNYLVVSFKNYFQVITLNKSLGIFSDSQTFAKETIIAAFPYYSNKSFFITQKEIVYFNFTNFTIIETYQFPQRAVFSTYLASQNIIAVSLSNNVIAFYSLNQRGNICAMENIAPIQTNYCVSALTSNNDYLIAYSEWIQNRINIVDIRNPQHKYVIDQFGNQKIVKSLLFHEDNKLFAGFSDGTLIIFYYELKEQEINIKQQKIMIIGFKPVKLRFLQQQIACISNEVSILNLKKIEGAYERYEKTYFNIQNINQIDQFEIQNIQYLIWFSKNQLGIGSIELNQKYHITQFGNTKVISEDAQSELIQLYQNYCVSVSIYEKYDQDIEKSVHSQIFLHSIKNQDLLDFKVIENSCINTILVMNSLVFLGGESQKSEDNKEGFLTIYKIDSEGKFIYLQTFQFSVPIQHIEQFSSTEICVVIGNETFKIYTVNFEKNDNCFNQKLLQEIITQTSNPVVALGVDCNEKNKIVIADSVKGIYLFECSKKDKKSIAICQSPFPVFCTNTKFIGDEVFFSDRFGNVFIVKYNENAENDLEKIKMVVLAYINNGDLIQTSIKRKVNTKQINDKYISKDYLNQIIFGTNKGTVGIIMSLNEQTFNVLYDLQESILQKFKCPLNFSYFKWKQVRNVPISKQDKILFIDGDIIFKLQKMNHIQINDILNGMSVIPKPSIFEIEQLIENLDHLIF